MLTKGTFVRVGDVARALSGVPVSDRDARSMTTREFLTQAAEARRRPVRELLPGYLDTLEACARANACRLCARALQQRREEHQAEADPVRAARARRDALARDQMEGVTGLGRKVG